MKPLSGLDRIRPIAVLLLITLVLVAATGWQAAAGPSEGAATLTEWTFQGRVYEGEVGDESHPLEGITVAVYGANNPYPDSGVWIRSTTTNAEGWYGLTVYDDDGPWEFYHIRQTNRRGYTSVGATTVGGTVRTDDWIEYVIPLERKVLTGNKFWDRPEGAETPVCHTFEGRVFEGRMGDETRPLAGVTVELHGANNPYPDPGVLLVGTVTDREGGYGLTICGEALFFEFYSIREFDPPGYTSVGASSTDGVVREDNWIEYVVPLEGKTLSGDKFWDTPIPADTPTPTATSPRATDTPTPSPTPTGTLPPGCQQLLVNGDFESGALPPWNHWGPVSIATWGHNSEHSAALGGIDGAEGELFQEVAIPARARPVRLEFWWLAESGAEQPEDALEVIVQYDEQGDHLRTLRAVPPLGQWRYEAIDLSEYAGRTVFVTFLVHTDGELPSTFHLDDIQLHACGVSTSTPTQTQLPTASSTATRTPTRTPTPTATPISINVCASVDAYIAQQAPTFNHGNASTLLTGYSTGPDPVHHRALALFDLSFIPTGATVKSASFQAYVTHATGSLSPVTIGLYQVMAFWYESGVTWANQPAVASYPIATSALDNSLGYKSWNVTSLVQGWVNGTIPNLGLELRGPEADWWARTFSSREGAHCPQLVLTLESPAPIETPTATSTPWPTSTPTQIPTPVSRQVQITGWQVNQAVQFTSTAPVIPPVPLIAGKSAVVRVFLRVADGQGPIPGVTGSLEYPYPGGAIFSPINQGGTVTVLANPSANVMAQSLNFLIPSQYAQGSGTMLLRVFPPAGVTFSSMGELQKSWPNAFQQTPPLRVYLVEVTYNMDGKFRYVREGAVSDIRSHLKREYPVGQAIVEEHVFGIHYNGSAQDFCNGDAFSAVNKALAKMRSFTKNVSGATLFYGMVPSDYGSKCGSGFVVGGMAAGIPAGEASGQVYAGAFSTGDKAAHELAHCLGRYHADACCGAQGGKPFPYADCSIGLLGVDIQSLVAYPPTTKELMGYCNVGSRWVSDFTYKALRDRIVQLSSASARASQEHQALLVSGLMNKTQGTLQLDPLYRVTVDTLSTPEDGPCAIVLRDAAGALLAEHPFMPPEHTSQLEAEEEVVALYRAVPDHPNVAQVDVQCEGQVWASQTASAHPPTVALLSPNGGEHWASGTQTITWQAHDADSDPLTFSLQFSGDNGETWQAVAVDLQATTYSFDTALLGGSEQARIRVIATDGLWTAQDASDALFSVATKAPRVTIDWPHDGAVLPPDTPALFNGSASDPEDGPLAGEALLWESDRDGPLGHGEEVLLPTLSSGAHRITLSTTDRDGRTGSASVRVYVGHQAYLPIVIR
jgi:hypothetical protein